MFNTLCKTMSTHATEDLLTSNGNPCTHCSYQDQSQEQMRCSLALFLSGRSDVVFPELLRGRSMGRTVIYNLIHRLVVGRKGWVQNLAWRDVSR